MFHRMAFGALALLGATTVLCSCSSRSVGSDPSDPVDPVDPVPECTVLSYTFDIHYLNNELVNLEPMPLEASGSWVYYTDTGTGGSNSPDDPEIFVVNTDTEAVSQVTADDRQTRLLDADGRAVLWADSAGVYGEPSTLYFQPDAEQLVELGQYSLHYPIDSMGFYTEAPHRLVDGRTAAWSSDTGVYYYDGAQVIEILRTESPNWALPYLRDGTVVFALWDGNDNEIHRWRDGTLEQLTDNNLPDDRPGVSDGRVFWACNASICVWDEADPEVRVLDTGDWCHEPDADQGQAVWICDDQVKVYDGETVSQLTSTDQIRSGPRIQNGRIVWLEIQREDPPDYYTERGRIQFSDGTDIYEVATIGLPCIYCGAYWPPVGFSFTGELIAWTYALQPDDPDSPDHYGVGFSAYAKVQEITDCE
ncbi:MAG: hypothetical protein ABI333_16195 [bacterium]